MSDSPAINHNADSCDDTDTNDDADTSGEAAMSDDTDVAERAGRAAPDSDDRSAEDEQGLGGGHPHRRPQSAQAGEESDSQAFQEERSSIERSDDEELTSEDSSTESLGNNEDHAIVEQRIAALTSEWNAIETSVQQRKSRLSELLTRVRDVERGTDKYVWLCKLAQDAFRDVRCLNGQLETLASRLSQLGHRRSHAFTQRGMQRSCFQEAATRAFEGIGHAESMEVEQPVSDGVLAPILYETHCTLAPYGVCPGVFDEALSSALYRRFQECVGAGHSLALVQLAEWFVVLKLGEDVQDEQLIAEKLATLQCLMQQSFELPQVCALQAVFLHVALLSQMCRYVATDRISGWNQSRNAATHRRGDGTATSAPTDPMQAHLPSLTGALIDVTLEGFASEAVNGASAEPAELESPPAPATAEQAGQNPDDLSSMFSVLCRVVMAEHREVAGNPANDTLQDALAALLT
eukprot:scaffold19_cov336-Pinguiococcus_pyrenoidosus.AAC.2